MKISYTVFVPVVAALPLTQTLAADDPEADEHHILDEIIVAATPLERTVEQLAQPTSVLAGDALTKKQAASIGETLVDELGVSASYFGPVASRPVIRGQFGERVRVLSNGLDALDASALSEDHAVGLDSILADSVEIVRGPATLLYGSGAAGGIVNIVDSRIPSEPLEPGFSGALALNGDTAVGTRSGALKVDYNTGSLTWHLDAFRRDTDEIEIPGFAESKLLRALEEAEHEEEHGEEEEAFGKVENTDSEVEGSAAAVTFNGRNGFVGVSVSQYDSIYGIPGHAHEHEEGEEEGAEEEEEEEEIVRIDLDQTRYDVKAQYDLNNFFRQANLRVARNDYRHVELEGDEVGTLFKTLGTDVRLEMRHRSLGNWEGAFGFQLKDVDFTAEGDEAYVPSSDTAQIGLFVFEELTISDSWVLQASARIEQQEIKTAGQSTFDESAFGASVGSIWSLPNNLTLAANLAWTERSPNATELYADGGHVAVDRYERGSLTPGNTFGVGELDKEVSTNFDLTLRGSLDRVEWTVTGFLNRVDDYILLSPTAEVIDDFQVFDYGQRDVELYGLEAEATIDIVESDNGHLHARLFGDFVHGEERQSGAYLPRLPGVRWGAGLHFTQDNLDASVDVAFTDDQEKTASNELPTESFTMINAEVSWTFEDPHMLVFLRGTNLGDEDARRHTSPLKDIIPLPGRSVSLGLRYDF